MILWQCAAFGGQAAMIRALSGSPRHSFRAMARTFAALLLVLHWTAPGVLQAAALRGIFTGDSGFSSGIRASQPVALPHILPRTAATPSAAAKPKRDPVKLGGNHQALLPQVLVPSATFTAETVLFLPAPVRSTTKRTFDARGPPASADA
jgi:hypothetical protein